MFAVVWAVFGQPQPGLKTAAICYHFL